MVPTYNFLYEDDLDKKTFNPKSEGVRDILRTVLGGIHGTDLNKDKPSINLLTPVL